MALLTKELLLLPVPREVILIDELPLPTPNNVVVFELPVRMQFITVLLVAASDPFVCIHTIAEEVPVLLLTMVRSLLAATGGQTVLVVDPTDPSMMTLSAPFRRMMAVVLLPDMVVVIVGLIVSVNGPPVHPVEIMAFSILVPFSVKVGSIICANKLPDNPLVLISAKRPPASVRLV